MLPLYPPYPFVELAKEHLGRHQRKARRGHPDALNVSSTRSSGRQPRPKYLGLRSLLASGPIAALSARFNQKHVEREGRPSGPRIDPIASVSTVTEMVVLLNVPTRDHHERELAA